MPLEKQIQIYSVDTGSFYSNNEAALHWSNHKLRSQRRKLVDESKEIELEFEKVDISKDDICNLDDDTLEELGMECLAKRYCDLKEWIHIKNLKIKESKDKLLKLLENKVEANVKSNGTHHIRQLRDDAVTEKNVISVFDSYFTRTIGAEPDMLSEDFMVVQVYYFDVIKDLIYHGFEYKGEKYVYFTSSAGQIRTKKTVFVKESVWKKYEKSIMCGLTIDDINAKGGNNPNKHLAYLALANSATDVWEEFDIDKTIVIDDFETEVDGEYDLVDDVDYTITRTLGKVPITHTDGAGMMLPCMGKNRMVRLPWVKGLLGAFDFRKFIEVNCCSPIIKDIYGELHDIIEEDIQIIFTKSQFKMAKYYDSWEQYKEMYKKYGCTAGITNVDEDKIRDATINYQMLQSLTDITDDEIDEIAKPSIDRLNNLCSSKESIKHAFGVTPYNTNKNAFQKSIELYPNLLNDEYVKSQLKTIKDSMIKKYKAGKLHVRGKYTFILPDFYAACQYWFMDIENPKGLLEDGEVFCWLFRKSDKLDCLRSPHLYREHAVRKNIAWHKIDNERRDWLREWYCTDAVYTSCHDLISKILQFDVDGDKALVVSDKAIIKVAERNMRGIVPLYYNMKKAEPIKLSNASIYNGLNAAFVGGNIGIYSNNISKIWNSDVFVSGTEEEKQQAIDIIKILCMENNFVIDYAKTLYKPERSDNMKELIKNYTRDNLPHFFKYAKDKKDSQVIGINDSFVNKLNKLVPNPRINCRKLEIEEVDYKLLMDDPDVECKVEFTESGNLIKENTDPLIVKYCELNKMHHFSLEGALKVDTTFSPEVLSKSQLRHELKYQRVYDEIRKELSCFGYDDTEVADILVKFSYHIKNTKHKAVLWMCYGDIIYANLENNKKVKRQTKEIQCIDCGEWFEVGVFDSATCRCDECQKEHRKEEDRIRKQECSEFGDTKSIICCDCRKEFKIDVKDTRTERCKDCYSIYRKQKKSEAQKARRLKDKMKSDQIPHTL